MDTPLPHQLEAASVLGARSILADKRGLGKTLSSLLWAKQSKRLLCLARKEVAENFLEEIEIWFPERKPLNLISKPVHERRVTLQICSVLDEFTLVVNLEAWRKDKELVNALVNLHFDTVIIDEAHALKDEDTSAFKGVRDIVHTVNVCADCGHHELMELPTGTFCTNCFSLNSGAPSVQRLQMLTGTPFLNTPYDIWPLLHLIDNNHWPSQQKYLRDYCYQNYDGRWKFRPGAERRILEWLGTNYLARTREDAGVILPPQKIQPYHIEFTKTEYPNQWDVYHQIKDYAALKISETDVHDIVSMLALITRLRQAIVWPAGIRIGDWTCDIRESVKIDAAEKLAWELIDEGHKIVLYSQFRPPLRELHRRLGPQSVLLDGNTSSTLRKEIRRDFDRRYASNRWRCLLSQSRVGGESLNFNAATAGIIIDREWSPGREDQETGRLDRMGQTEESIMYILQAEPSIDQWQNDLIVAKQEMLDGFESELRDKLKEYLLS